MLRNNDDFGMRDGTLPILFFVLICTTISRWLICCYFVEGAAASGIDFKHTDGESGKRSLTKVRVSGGFFDYDNDGYLNIFINARPQREQTTPAPPTTSSITTRDGSYDILRVAGVGRTATGGCNDW